MQRLEIPELPTSHKEAVETLKSFIGEVEEQRNKSERQAKHLISTAQVLISSIKEDYVRKSVVYNLIRVRARRPILVAK